MPEPTKERMDEVWKEMKSWPMPHKSSFALTLIQLTMVEANKSVLDLALSDETGETYILAGMDKGAQFARHIARTLLAEGFGTPECLKPGNVDTELTKARKDGIIDKQATYIAELEVTLQKLNEHMEKALQMKLLHGDGEVHAPEGGWEEWTKQGCAIHSEAINLVNRPAGGGQAQSAT